MGHNIRISNDKLQKPVLTDKMASGRQAVNIAFSYL
jgi:hypothetical protein